MSNWLQDQIDDAREGDVIDIGRATTVCNDTVVVDKAITIRGSATFRATNGSTIAAPGLKITDLDARIQGVIIDCENAPVNGIEMLQRADIIDCQIRNAGLDGIHVNASVGGNPPGNANMWTVTRVRARGGRHGLFVDGGDVNSGCITTLDISNCGGWGVFDSGFLGNTYIGCHVSANHDGAYHTDNPNAYHRFLGCDSEPNQPPSVVERNTIKLGGHHAAGWIGGTDYDAQRISGVEVSNAHEDSDMRVYLHTLVHSGLDVIVNGDHPRGWSLAFHDQATGTVQFRYKRHAGYVPLMLTTQVSTLLDEQGNTIPAGCLVFGRNVYSESETMPGRYKEVTL